MIARGVVDTAWWKPFNRFPAHREGADAGMTAVCDRDQKRLSDLDVRHAEPCSGEVVENAAGAAMAHHAFSCTAETGQPVISGDVE